MAIIRALSRSIKAKIIISLVVVVTIILSLFGFYAYRAERQFLNAELDEFTTRKINRLAENLSLPLWEVDSAWVNRIIASEMTDPNVYAVLVTGDGDLQSGNVRDAQWRAVVTSEPAFAGDFVSLKRDVLHGLEKIGAVEILLTRKFVEQRLRQKTVFGLLTQAGLSTALIIFLLLVLNRLIIRPLQTILATARAVGEGDYSGELILGKSDEVGMLAQEVNLMSRKISSREQELARTLHELQQAHAEMEQKVEARTHELSLANERLKELDQLKSMFIASMSHELRTPLNSIIGFTGMTLEGLSGELNEEQQDNLRRVLQSGQHLLGLISDVIDISKIEAGRIDVFPERFSLQELVDEALAFIQPLADKKQLALALDAPVWPEILSDRKRLMQCLLNFLSNAVKFSEQGSVTVMVRQQKGDVEIAVRDTGIGIEKGDLGKLFEAFERLDTHLRVKAGGSGLGLYLTRKIATELLGGSVRVESAAGQGSTFYLNIPQELKPDNTGVDTQ